MGTGDSASDQMDTEILESMAELFASMLTRAEEVAQRFGVPMGYGGPHAAFIASRAAHQRGLPGRPERGSATAGLRIVGSTKN